MSRKINEYLKNRFNRATPDILQSIKDDCDRLVCDDAEISGIGETVRKRQRKASAFKKLSAAAVCAVIAAALIFNPLSLFKSEEEPDVLSLCVVENEKMLEKLFSGKSLSFLNIFSDFISNLINLGAHYTGSAAPGESVDDYSKTNTQVDGVDEADIIKTDGKYVYYISEGSLYIVDIKDPENMKIETKKQYHGKEAPLEMYVDGDYLVVISGNSNNDYEYGKVDCFTRICVFDISDKADVKTVRDYSFDGSYSTSRKIGDIVYIIGNKPVYNSSETSDLLPKYRDDLKDNGTWVNIPVNQINYFSTLKENDSLQYIVGINVKDSSSDANIQTFISNGNTVYATDKNIYIAGTKYNYIKEERNILKDALNVITGNYSDYDYIEQETVITKFTLDNGKAVFHSMGVVKGHILNQFSMDEYNGNFRIAATANNRSLGQSNSVNNLYILDSNMQMMGSVENLAKGESIYSVWFMGAKVYIVTYKTVDPLFVIDAEDPENPKVLGELKIPGYSTYLHPYDETHLIGFGMNTKEVDKDFALIDGIKIAMFDVSDFHNPKELFNTSLGERGSYSELLYNHKALLFSKEKNIFAFPATVYDKNEYEVTYQGFFNYSIDMEKGFILNGTVTHKEGDFGYYKSDIVRGVYSGDVLFTFSGVKIMANSLDGMELIGEIAIK